MSVAQQRALSERLSQPKPVEVDDVASLVRVQSKSSEDRATLSGSLRPSALRQSSQPTLSDAKSPMAASSKGSVKLNAERGAKPPDSKPKKSVKISLPNGDDALLSETRKADPQSDALRLLLNSVQDGNSSLDSSIDSRAADSLESSLSSVATHDKKRLTAKRKAAARSDSKLSLKQLSAAHEKLSETIADHKQFRDLLWKTGSGWASLDPT